MGELSAKPRCSQHGLRISDLRCAKNTLTKCAYLLGQRQDADPKKHIRLKAYEVEIMRCLKIRLSAGGDDLCDDMGHPDYVIRKCVGNLLEQGYVAYCDGLYRLTETGEKVANSIANLPVETFKSTPSFSWDFLYIPENFILR